MLLTLKVDLTANKISHDEFLTFIRGGAALDLATVPPKPYAWIMDPTWLNIVELSKLPQFSELVAQVGRNEKAWKTWFDSESLEEAPLPDGYQSTLDAFRRLLLVRAWSPDRVINMAMQYISESMGERYAQGVVLDIEATWRVRNMTL